MRIVGMVYPILIRCLCSSTPVIVGMWTSAIKQAVSTRRGDARKSAADAKASTAKPIDRMSLRMDSRKNRSSSTTETNALGMLPPAVRPYPRDAGSAAMPSLPAPYSAPKSAARECKHWLMLEWEFRKLDTENAAAGRKPVFLIS
jgi:hypothetical protein